MTFLAEHFPHAYPQASLLYTVSSVGDVGKGEIVRAAKKNGVKVVLNQNGVAFPAWHGPGWEAANAKQRAVYQQADFIIYQSEFCKLSAQKFLGLNSTPSVVLFNPVDLELYRFVQKADVDRGPVLLLGGNQYEKYRFDSALLILKETLRLLPGTRLLITGKLWGEDQQLSMDSARRAIRELDLEKQVEFTGTYSQQAAPSIFQRADILIHTKYHDPSPNLISEALASGLPVVYSASGGVPELVGPVAGIGVPVEQSWEKISLPDPRLAAEAIAKVWDNLPYLSQAARQRAEEQFPLEKFVQAHRQIFTQILG
jgi:glycosyltransferase involved in cell wall biosynthesis